MNQGNSLPCCSCPPPSALVWVLLRKKPTCTCISTVRSQLTESGGLRGSRLTVGSQKTQESRWLSSSLDLRAEGTSAPAPRQAGREKELFLVLSLFCSGLQLIGWGPPALGRAVFFTQLKSNLIRTHPQRGFQKQRFPKYLGTLWST